MKISNTLTLDVDAFVTSTQAILAKKGSGKSYTASVEAEELLELGQQVVVVDPTGAWWGLRSSADGASRGYSIAVLGGEHADVPLEPTAGEVIADAIASEHFAAIIDLSLFRKGEALRFMATFLETLYRKNRDALHLFIDEADVVAPQKTFGPDQARVLGATEDIVRRGRIRGIGCTLITQRPQVVNKDVLSQVDMLTCLRMNHPKDLGAIDDWVAVHGDPAAAKRMIASLPSLPIGDAWLWAPGSVPALFERVSIRRRGTFDSGRTPKAGERTVAPKVLAPVDIQRLGATIAATVERAKQDDPKALHARIAELEKLVAAKSPAPAKTIEVEKIVEKPVLEMKTVDRLADTLYTIEHRVVPLEHELRELRGELVAVRSALLAAGASVVAVPIASKSYGNAHPDPIADIKQGIAAVERRVHPVDASIVEPDARDESRGSITTKQVVDAIGAIDCARLPQTVVAIAAWLNVHPRSSTFLKSLGEARRDGFVEGTTLTRRGLEIAEARVSEDSVRDTLRRPLSESQQRIIDAIASFDRAITVQALAAWVGAHPRSSSFLKDLGKVRERGYVNGTELTPIGAAAAETRRLDNTEILEQLEDSQRRIVEVIRDAGACKTVAVLAAALGVHPRSSTFLGDVGKLRERGLVTKGWPLQLTDVFQGAAS